MIYQKGLLPERAFGIVKLESHYIPQRNTPEFHIPFLVMSENAYSLFLKDIQIYLVWISLYFSYHKFSLRLIHSHQINFISLILSPIISNNIILS